MVASSGEAQRTPRPGTDDPRRSRQRALKVLFQADLRGRDPRVVLDAIADDPAAMALLDDGDVDEVARTVGTLDDYARALVAGVGAHLAEVDEVIEQFARRWTVPRMPVVDRNVLRLGVYELLHEEDLSSAVVIDEAVELAKGMSTDNSARFVNGVLEAVRRSRGQQDDTSG